MKRSTLRLSATSLVTAVALSATIAGCTTQQDAGASPRIIEKTFAFTPDTMPLKVSILQGELTGLKVVERINATTKQVVDQPELRGTLKLRNATPDQAVRLISAKIGYLDTSGKPIALAEKRRDTSVKFYSYQADRLDPGMESSHDVAVPFPAVALAGKTLGDIRVEVTYLPTPYRVEGAEVRVSLVK